MNGSYDDFSRTKSNPLSIAILFREIFGCIRSIDDPSSVNKNRNEVSNPAFLTLQAEEKYTTQS